MAANGNCSKLERLELYVLSNLLKPLDRHILRSTNVPLPQRAPNPLVGMPAQRMPVFLLLTTSCIRIDQIAIVMQRKHHKGHIACYKAVQRLASAPICEVELITGCHRSTFGEKVTLRTQPEQPTQPPGDLP
jgi:hypothetical protein